jgi:RND superfamily putative drug exporter
MTSRFTHRFPGARRLAELATARPRRVLATWTVLVLLGGALAAALLPSGLTSDGDVTNNPESTQARRLIDARLSGRDEVDEVVVVRSERAHTTDPAFRARVRALVGAARRSGAVRRIRSYLDPGGGTLISADRHATMLPLVLAEPGDDRIEALLAIVARADGRDGFAVDVTGEHTAGRDFGSVSASDLRRGELRFGLPAALIVLLLVFGTLVAAAIPLIVAAVSIVVALGLVAVAGQVFELNLFVVNMLVAMGLALGIDYSLFIVSRAREERGHGAAPRAAIVATAGTATRAVVLSGSAFSLAMLGMLLVPDMILRSLAFGAIVVGVVSMLVALTLQPALLMVLGDGVDRLGVPWLGRRVAAAAGRPGRVWTRLVRAVLRRPAVALLASVALLVTAASPVLGLQIGSSGSSSLPDRTVAKQGLLAIQRDFPSGVMQPITVVVDGERTEPGTRAGLRRLRASLERDPVFAATAAAVRTGPAITVLSVPLRAQPHSRRASAAVDRLRQVYVPAAFPAAAGRVKVGGGPAEDRDYHALIARWLPWVMAFVLSLSLVLLTLAFRSLVAAWCAIAVNLLSVGAAYGLLVLVFQHGIGAGLLGFDEVERVDAWVPVFLFCVLFGLSTDYQVFLLSRVHERYLRGGSTREGIIHGVGSTARLITGAALIIVVVFAGFATGELVAFQQMGFGVAVALLVDATIVRCVVIPAAMGLLGERNWYLPRWLRWLPEVAVEGRAAQSRLVGR